MNSTVRTTAGTPFSVFQSASVCNTGFIASLVMIRYSTGLPSVEGSEVGANGRVRPGPATSGATPPVCGPSAGRADQRRPASRPWLAAAGPRATTAAKPASISASHSGTTRRRSRACASGAVSRVTSMRVARRARPRRVDLHGQQHHRRERRPRIAPRGRARPARSVHPASA